MVAGWDGFFLVVYSGYIILSCIPALKTMQGTKSQGINVSEQSLTVPSSFYVALTEEKENPGDQVVCNLIS